jgi:energy-coupling factor transporter transmembrane protein EcfT
MAKIFKRWFFFALKVFGVLLLVLFFIWLWPETLKILKERRLRKFYDGLYGRKGRQRFPLSYDKEKIRKRKLWNEFFELQKQRFYQRQEELREEFSKEIKQMRTQTNRKELK